MRFMVGDQFEILWNTGAGMKIGKTMMGLWIQYPWHILACLSNTRANLSKMTQNAILYNQEFGLYSCTSSSSFFNTTFIPRTYAIGETYITRSLILGFYLKSSFLPTFAGTTGSLKPITSFSSWIESEQEYNLIFCMIAYFKDAESTSFETICCQSCLRKMVNDWNT